MPRCPIQIAFLTVQSYPNTMLMVHQSQYDVCLTLNWAGQFRRSVAFPVVMTVFKNIVTQCFANGASPEVTGYTLLCCWRSQCDVQETSYSPILTTRQMLPGRTEQGCGEHGIPTLWECHPGPAIHQEGVSGLQALKLTRVRCPWMLHTQYNMDNTRLTPCIEGATVMSAVKDQKEITAKNPHIQSFVFLIPHVFEQSRASIEG